MAGSKRKYTEDDYQFLVDNKDQIVTTERGRKKIRRLNDDVWETLESCTGKSSDELHNLAVSMKDMLLNGAAAATTTTTTTTTTTSITSTSEIRKKTTKTTTTTTTTATTSQTTTSRAHEFRIPKQTYSSLLITGKERNGKNGLRNRTHFKDGWTHVLRRYLPPSRHYFTIATHKLTMKGSGKINGNCKCGGVIIIMVENEKDSEETICTYEIRNENKYCTADQDTVNGRPLRKVEEEVIREPGYGGATRNAQKRVDKDELTCQENPIKNLVILKKTPFGLDVIRDIGIDPFFVHVYSKAQKDYFKKFAGTSILKLYHFSDIATRFKVIDIEKTNVLDMIIACLFVNDECVPIFFGIFEVVDSLSITMLLKKFLTGETVDPLQVVVFESSTTTNLRSAASQCFGNVQSLSETRFSDRDKSARTEIWSCITDHYGKNIAVDFVVKRLIRLAMEKCQDEASRVFNH